MEYNTTKQPLILPEYGRNVQMMADYLLTIDDRERRTEAAKELVSIMVNMNPAVRETKDYRQKMWNFLAEMCEYKLDVDFPFPITKVTDLPKPERLQYNLNDIRFRHYGYTVERMIKAAVELPEGEEKDVLVRMIANNMKRNYVLWNQKSVTDEIIVNLHDSPDVVGTTLQVIGGVAFSIGRPIGIRSPCLLGGSIGSSDGIEAVGIAGDDLQCY